MAENNYKGYLTQLETNLDEYFGKKAPALPANIKEIVVNFAPYLVIISLLITVPGILILLGLGGLVTSLVPFAATRGVTSLPVMWIGIILLIPEIILEAMALPGLFARKRIGWTYIFWAQLLSFVSSLMQLYIIGAIIGAIIGFYFLFQVRSYYK